MELLVFLSLLLVSVGWALLPLLPAVRELARPSDVEPLRMVGRDNADISRFARHFRQYVTANLNRLPPEHGAGDYFGKLPDGTHFVRVARLPGVLSTGALPDGSHDRVVVLEHPVHLPGHEKFRLELWARDEFAGGSDATYRAVLGEKSVRLGEGSLVLRWIHAAGPLLVGNRSVLYGRVSSDHSVTLGAGVGFERVGAPLIVAEHGAASAALPPEADLVPVAAPDGAERLGDHTRITDDWVLPPRGLFEGNLVVTGRLRLGAGSRVRGSVKGGGAVELEAGAVVEGAIVSRADILLDDGARALGPVIAEQQVVCGHRVGIGLSDSPTTVSAAVVTLSTGTWICGHVVTQEGGQTDS